MRIPNTLPDLAIVRALTAAGPFRVGQMISIAFATPTVGRLVPHDAQPLVQADSLDGAMVPETMSATVTYAAGPYGVGDVLTLSFIDPRVARIHPNLEHPASVVEARATPAVGETTQRLDLQNDLERVDADWQDVAVSRDVSQQAKPNATEPLVRSPLESRPVNVHSGTSTESSESTHLAAGSDEGDRARCTVVEPVNRDEAQVVDVNGDAHGVDINGDADVADVNHSARATNLDGDDTRPRFDAAVTSEDATDFGEPTLTRDAFENSEYAVRDGRVAGATFDPHPTQPDAGVYVRLHWNRDRVRRFIQVVDKLFTVDRLGWYRHALAMRLLIPDEVTCGDPLGDIESMRHLHALRAAAVETLGRPLLAAFMPNFTVSAEWLGTIDSPAAARALAGLRDAVTPYVEDDVAPRADNPALTVGAIGRYELLGASAASVEALLPVLIPTASPNATLAARLGDYRRMLIAVFGQTARSSETVRLNQMAQPNHALDDRLWQLVGAVGEAFDGLAVA